MHPSSNHSLMTPLAYAVSLGLLLSTAPLELTAMLHSHSAHSLQAISRSEDDRGSGRLSRVPAITNWLSFRGSGRVDPESPGSSSVWHGSLAYRGSGRITEPETA
ncbi:hypothetical protein [Nodosilinea nodulosa]|uniref:hypothetical protein n=1 Tax=Nodosilinea nodulosa TaxID=416001 RepID=UPI0012D773BC|nr:hypothetical protein [Nodosilinea nodulosa]